MTSSTHRRRARLGLLGAFVVLAASVSALLLVPRYSRPVAVADVGTAAPDFHLYDTTGRPVALSDFRGHPVVLFFSSIDCPRSADYCERIDRLARQFADGGQVKFLALNVSPSEHLDPWLVRTDDRVAKRSFPTLLDPKGAVATRYSADKTPMTVVLDPRGLVRYRGPFDDNADAAFVTRTYAADAVRNIVGTDGIAIAGR